MHSHNRTLLAKLGFADPDKKLPRHDLGCQYVALGMLAAPLPRRPDAGVVSRSLHVRGDAVTMNQFHIDQKVRVVKRARYHGQGFPVGYVGKIVDTRTINQVEYRVESEHGHRWCFPEELEPLQLTAEERKAAGWTECWGVYRDDKGWWTHNMWERKPKRRRDFEDEKTARLNCGGVTRPRRFWRRKKQRPEPQPVPFEVGQWVTVQGSKTFEPWCIEAVPTAVDGEYDLAHVATGSSATAPGYRLCAIEPGAIQLQAGDVVEYCADTSQPRGTRGTVQKVDVGSFPIIVQFDNLTQLYQMRPCELRLIRRDHAKTAPQPQFEVGQWVRVKGVNVDYRILDILLERVELENVHNPGKVYIERRSEIEPMPAGAVELQVGDIVEFVGGPHIGKRATVRYKYQSVSIGLAEFPGYSYVPTSLRLIRRDPKPGAELKPGDRVRVELEGTIDSHSQDGSFLVRLPDEGRGELVWLEERRLRRVP